MSDWIGGAWSLPTFEPTEVMLRALIPLQRDLDASGLERYQMSYAVAGGTQEWPTVNVQYRGTWTSDGLDVTCEEDAAMLQEVAEMTAQLFMEHEDVYWPICNAHDRRTRAVPSGGAAVWLCTPLAADPHTLSPIGDLGELLAMDPRPIFKPLDRR